MEVQELGNMKFFFWSDTLRKEYDLIQNRLVSGESEMVKPDAERISMLIGKYADDFKTELDKITEFLSSLLEEVEVRKESIQFNIDDYKYTSVLQGNGHQFVVKGFAGRKDSPYISVIIDNTERRFDNAKSLISALTTMANKVSNKEASTKVAANFDAALREFLDYCNDVREKYFSKMGNKELGHKWFHKLIPMNGSKYVKIISTDALLDKDSVPKDSDFTSKSAWAFIDKTTGEIFKPASYSAPAKHARGNVFDKNTWNTVSAFGPAYMR